MNREELIAMLAGGENSSVEFKRDDCRPEQLAKELVAFLNFHGGTVLLGIDDDGTVIGLQRDKAEEWVMNVFSSKIHPSVLPLYQELVLDGTCVAIIQVAQGTAKPYVVRHGNKEEIFVRMGSTSRLATREQQATLFAAGGLLHAEALPVSGATLASLDRLRLHDYLSRVLRDPEIPASDEAWTQRLIGLGYLTPGQGSDLVTIAGLVLFGVSPRRYLRHAGIRLMIFEGDDVDSRALLDETLDGSLVGLWRTDGTLARLAQQDYGLLERLSARLEPYITTELPVNTQFRRDREIRFPLDVIRELVVNAMAHRDWTRAIETEVRVFSNRLEVVSPGALHNSMTVMKMIAGQRYPRNPLIVETLRDYGYIEARGMGVRTKVIPITREHLGTEPVFEATEDFLKTTLRLA